MTQKKKYRLRIEDKCSFCFFQLQTFLWCCALRRVSRWSQSWRGVKSLSPMQLTRSIATNFFRYFILSKYNFLSFFIITSLKSYENGFSLYWLVNGLDFIRSSSSWHVQVWLSNILNSEELPDDLFWNKWRISCLQITTAVSQYDPNSSNLTVLIDRLASIRVSQRFIFF